MSTLTIALAGNPNAGKSTIFNALTGLRQHTANWPGKTVEKKAGYWQRNGVQAEIVDLPGTYSLAAFSPDEMIARDYITDEHPDAVICVLDASNLERNLYLAVQILELGVSVVVALNMTDRANAMGIEIDRCSLSRLLGGAPVISTVASRGQGIEELMAATVERVSTNGAGCPCRNQDSFRIDYGEEIEKAIRDLEKATSAGSSTTRSSGSAPDDFCPRWLALKLLETDPDVVERVKQMPGGMDVFNTSIQLIRNLEESLDEDLEIITADRRYGFVSDVSRQVVNRPAAFRVSLSDRIDNIVTHRMAGLPIFMAVMYVVFRLVIDVSDPYLNWVDEVFNGPIARWLGAGLAVLGSADWLHSLVIEGVLAGVGGILVFLPGLTMLYFFLALLEDSGYMARAAFVMDRFMQVIGLHGKSVIPLILGFGCAVPAVYATRTIAGRRDRLLTALLIPFMSCSARLPVYLVFAMAFFRGKASLVIWLMYALGVVMAMLIGLLFSRSLLKPDENEAFVLELPPYRMPTLRGLLIHTWENSKEFVRKAGTVILAVSVVLWFLLNLPWGTTAHRDSYFGRLSMAIAPVFQPAGFGDWQSAGSLITGFIAKELVVSTLSQIHVGADSEADLATPASAGEEIGAILAGFGRATAEAGRTLVSLLPGIDLTGADQVEEDIALSSALRSSFSLPAAVAFLVFVLLYIPCVATISAIRHEFGWRWAATSATYQTAVAWLAAVGVYQVGRLMGIS